MEQIKDSFKHDFNLAVKSFNEKDYKTFFRNIRPAMELLGKLAIYDILGENDAIDLLEGDTSIEWKRDAKIYKISQYPANQQAENSVSLSLKFTTQNTLTSLQLVWTKRRNVSNEDWIVVPVHYLVTTVLRVNLAAIQEVQIWM